MPKKKLATDCEHAGISNYYAKGKCHRCYHRELHQSNGNTKSANSKLASCCPDKVQYAKGLCKNHYMAAYNRESRRRERKKIQKLAGHEEVKTERPAALTMEGQKTELSRKNSLKSDPPTPTPPQPPVPKERPSQEPGPTERPPLSVPPFCEGPAGPLAPPEPLSKK